MYEPSILLLRTAACKLLTAEDRGVFLGAYEGKKGDAVEMCFHISTVYALWLDVKEYGCDFFVLRGGLIQYFRW